MSKYSYAALQECWTHRPLHKERFSMSPPNHYDTDYPPWIVPQNHGDLASISGLIPNSIYRMTIQSLIATFLTDNSGVLYFNKHHDPLPISCIHGCVPCPSGSYCMSYKHPSVCHGITPVQPCTCPIKITPQFTTSGSPTNPLTQYVWTFKDNKITSKPMSIKKKMDFIPKYNFTSKSSKCPVTMTLDLRNWFPPGKGPIGETPPTALGHWKMKVVFKNGAFSYDDYNTGCYCSICQGGRFDAIPKGYSGSLELECTK